MLSLVYPRTKLTLQAILFKKDLIEPLFKENLLSIQGHEIEFKSKNPQIKHFGFDLKKDGIEVYFLSEQIWLVIAKASPLLPRAWFENRLMKAYECIPKHNIAISLVQFPSIEEDLLLFQECYAEFPSLKLLIGKDSLNTDFDHFLFHPLKKEAISLYFRYLDLEIIKDYLTLTSYDTLEKSSKPMSIHFSRKID